MAVGRRATKLCAAAAPAALPLVLGQGAASAGSHSGQLSYTDGSGDGITCDYYGESGIVGGTTQGPAYIENSIEQQTAPGCEAEMVLTVTYIDTGGQRRRASASSLDGRSLFLHSFDVASEYVATHDLYYLACQNPDPGSSCSVHFTTK